MYATMSMEVLTQRREQMLREAELYQLKKALQANRKRSATLSWPRPWRGAVEGR